MSEVRAETVVAEVEARWGSACASCEVALVGQEVVASWLMGFKSAPRCLPCLAEDSHEEPTALGARLVSHVRRLACYRAGWTHSERRLSAEGRWPHARLPLERLLDSDLEPEPDEPSPAEADTPSVADTWDAGDQGCGDLVLELRSRLRALAPGAVLELRATDPGAPADLPAWCRVTGHTLVTHTHPMYWIRRRAE